MKRLIPKILLSSFIASAIIFSGCGGGVEDIKSTQLKSSKQPHKITRVLDYDAEHADDWQNFVDMSASYDESNDNFILDVVFNEGITSDVKHFQIYLDTDYNSRTGYSDSSIKGADYLIEDGSLFKSTSNTEWEWEYVDEVYYISEELDDGKHHILVDDNGAAATMFTEKNHLYIDVSIEPLSAEWTDSHNFVKTRDLNLKVGNGAIAKRIFKIDGYSVPKPEHDGIIVFWKTLFYDIFRKNAYALNTYGGGGEISYPYGTYLSIIDVNDMQNPTLRTQLNVGDGYKALDMYTDRNYSYIFVENRPHPKGAAVSGKMILVNTSDKDNPFVVGSAGLCGGPMSLHHLVREGKYLHAFISDFRGRKHIRFDMSDPESQVNKK